MIVRTLSRSLKALILIEKDQNRQRKERQKLRKQKITIETLWIIDNTRISMIITFNT